MRKRAVLGLLLAASACQRNHAYPWPAIEGAQTLLLLALEDGADGGPDKVRMAQVSAPDSTPTSFNFFDRGISRYVALGYACTPERFGLPVGPLTIAEDQERSLPLPPAPRIAQLDPTEDEPSWRALSDPPDHLLAALDTLPEQAGDVCARLSLSVTPGPAVALNAPGSVLPRYLVPAGDGTLLLGTLGGANFRVSPEGEPRPFRFAGMERTVLAIAPRAEGGFWLFDSEGTLWRGPLSGPFEPLARVATSTSPGRLAALAPSAAGEPEEVFIMSSDWVLRRWDGARLEDIAVAAGPAHDYEAEPAPGFRVPIPFVPTVVRTGPSRALTFGLGLFDEAIQTYDHGRLDETRIPGAGPVLSIAVHPSLGIFASTIGAVYQHVNDKWTRLSSGGEFLFMFLLNVEGPGMLISGFDDGGGRVSVYARESGLCDNRNGAALVMGAALDDHRRVYIAMQVLEPPYDVTKGTAQVVRYDISRPFGSCTSAD